MSEYYIKDGELYHYGVKGMKWGVRRYLNSDGSLNAKGLKKKRKLQGRLDKNIERQNKADKKRKKGYKRD